MFTALEQKNRNCARKISSQLVNNTYDAVTACESDRAFAKCRLITKCQQQVRSQTYEKLIVFYY
jgi:hypothetical protein